MTDNPFFKQHTLLDLKAFSQDKLPEKIGPYSIEGLIAKSPNSLLYVGYHPEKRQLVALKVLPPHGAYHKQMMDSFLKEASIIGLTSHPNIVKLYEQGTWEGGLYLAMELVRGVSLKQFIQQSSLSIKRIIEIILQVSYALCHLHGSGIIHGDLKPENILISEDGEVKVVDFGIAQLFDQKNKNLLHAGTPSYMSPEHKKDIKNLSYKSDIYSLGIIAYELITGKLSWGIISKDNIPFYLRSILMQCVEPRAENRYSDIVDLIHDLLDVLKSEEIETKTPTSQGILLLEENFLSSLKKAFPTPSINMQAIDCGISHSFHSKYGTSPCLSLENPDGSYCLGLYESESSGMEKSLVEAKVYGFIETYQDFMREKIFSIKHFIEKLNTFCLNHHFKLKFSFLYINAYADEFISCHGGFLTPLLIKKNHPLPLEGSIQNSLLGASHDEMSFTSRFFEIGDQLLLHPICHPKACLDLSSLFLNHSLYSSQNLVDTLIKKGSDLQIKALICCVKVK